MLIVATNILLKPFKSPSPRKEVVIGLEIKAHQLVIPSECGYDQIGCKCSGIAKVIRKSANCG